MQLSFQQLLNFSNHKKQLSNIKYPILYKYNTIIFIQFQFMIKVLFLIKLLFIANACTNQQSCSINCICCESNATCLQCSPGFIITINFTCSSCLCTVRNCQKCDCSNSQKCLLCSQGYQWNIFLSKCSIQRNKLYDQNNKNSDHFESNGSIIIGLSIGSILAVMGIVLVIILIKKKCNKIQNNSIFPEISNSSRYDSSSLNQQSIDLNSSVQKVIQDDLSYSNKNNLYQQFKYDSERDNCTICLQSYCNIITQCKHYFHFQCLRTWSKTNNKCPSQKIICMKCRNKTKKVSIFSKKSNVKCQMNHFEGLVIKNDQKVTPQM